MKKVLLTLIIATVAIAADAQVWIGGSLSFRNYSEAAGTETEAKLNFKPEIGITVSEDWAMAVKLGYDVETPEEGSTVSIISINPYVRYNLMKLGNFKLFVDGGGCFSYNETIEDWDVSIKPGISYSFNEHFNIVTHLGDGLIFREGDTKSKNGFAFDVINSLAFSLNYVF